MSSEFDEIGGFMAANLKPFQPGAYFDKHMDCIRVLIADVSITEVRLNEYFTVARANNGLMAGNNVGFTIKGIAYLFNAVGLSLAGVHELVSILDRIIKEIPHTAVKQVLEEFSPVLKKNHVSVTFDEPEREPERLAA